MHGVDAPANCGDHAHNNDRNHNNHNNCAWTNDDDDNYEYGCRSIDYNYNKRGRKHVDNSITVDDNFNSNFDSGCWMRIRMWIWNAMQFCWFGLRGDSSVFGG
jgi:hypothetical protein